MSGLLGEKDVQREWKAEGGEGEKRYLVVNGQRRTWVWEVLRYIRLFRSGQSVQRIPPNYTMCRSTFWVNPTHQKNINRALLQFRRDDRSYSASAKAQIFVETWAETTE